MKCAVIGMHAWQFQSTMGSTDVARAVGEGEATGDRVQPVRAEACGGEIHTIWLQLLDSSTMCLFSFILS